jgi:hypothetical protein
MKDCKHLHLTRLAGPPASLTDGRAYQCQECKTNMVVDMKPLEVVMERGRQTYTPYAPQEDAQFKEWYLKFHGVNAHSQGCKSCDRWRKLTRQVRGDSHNSNVAVECE